MIDEFSAERKEGNGTAPIKRTARGCRFRSSRSTGLKHPIPRCRENGVIHIARLEFAPNSANMLVGANFALWGNP
jgi:hypothetical protein